MNWTRMILDGLTMSLFFNLVVVLGFLVTPMGYSVMFPKEIREAAARYVSKQDLRKMHLIVYPLYPAMFLFWGISAGLAGITGFRMLFWTGYLEMTFVSITDFIVLDCILPGKVRHMIRGAEHCRAWERKEWLLKLAIPEHGLIWPLVMCPIAGLAVAGIGSLL